MPPKPFPEADSELKLELSALAEAMKTIASTLDLGSVLDRLLYLTNQMLGFEYCTILLIDEEDERLTIAARYGYPQSIVQEVGLAIGKGLTGRVAETGESLIVADVSKEKRYLAGIKGARSELVVPMKFENRVIGVFDVQSTNLDVFTEHDRGLLSVLADIASVAITNARNHHEALKARDEQSRSRALQREIALARTFQERFLPLRDPEIAGFDIAGMNLPGTTLSGDYFDYIELPNGHVGVAVADVSGKGVPAALLAASLQATLRSHVENVYSIARIMERVNDLFCRITSPEHFATLFYGVFDPTGSLTYVNAGHNPPILISGNGTIRELSDGGTVLGMFPGLSYDEGRIRMLPGDTLVIYSDGLSEVCGGGEEFGEERIVQTVLRATGSTARTLASMLITEADSFADPEALVDDMTVVVTKKLAD